MQRCRACQFLVDIVDDSVASQATSSLTSLQHPVLLQVTPEHGNMSVTRAFNRYQSIQFFPLPPPSPEILCGGGGGDSSYDSLVGVVIAAGINP